MLPADELSRVLGHPRTVLDLAHGPSAALAKERGATVFEGEAALGEGKVDTILLPETDEAAVRRLGACLDDGGHVLATVSSERDVAMFEGAGLEILSVGRGPLFARTPHLVLVARKRPERRKLSLTVGMISMNEEGAVGAVIDDIRMHAPEAEVLLVDSSKDRTPEIAASKGARVIRQFPPKGYGPAMFRLLYEATTDVIITLDCDATYPADKILELHRLVEDGADLVNATRTRHRPSAMPFPNFLANRVFAGTAQALHGIPTTDVHSGMRAYRTSMLRGIDVDPRGPALPVDLLVVPARRGYRVVELEIEYFVRVGETTLHRFDSTKWTFKRLLRAALVGARARRDRCEVVG